MRAEPWEHHNPVRVLFGAGRLRELPELVHGPTLVVTTRGAARRGLTQRVTDLLHHPLVHDAVLPNPTVDLIAEAIEAWRGHDIHSVVALGGGSAIDVAKVLSLGLADDSVSVERLVEPVHPWGDLEPVPLIAVPTTAGTGAEVTPFATVWDDRAKRKFSIATPNLHPSAAIVDPELSLSLPWNETLSTGLDAYSQCFESICSRNSTPVSSALAERGLRLAPAALLELRDDAASIQARTAMAEAALLSGLAISQTRTGLPHSISYPITANFGVPHGLACALTLPAVLMFNSEVDDGRLERVAREAGYGGVDDLVPALLELYRDLGVAAAILPRLPDIRSLARHRDEMFTPGRADNNLRPATRDDIDQILADTAVWFEAGNA